MMDLSKVTQSAAKPGFKPPALTPPLKQTLRMAVCAPVWNSG